VDAQPPDSPTGPDETGGLAQKPGGEGVLVTEEPSMPPPTTDSAPGSGNETARAVERWPRAAGEVEAAVEPVSAPIGQPLKAAPGIGGEADEAIERWLLAADQALQQYRLTTPPEDNAYDYYQRVIKLDHDHEEALAGIDKIADRYAILARKQLNRGRYTLARRYVQRGIEVRSDHAELLALRAKIDKRSRARTAQRERMREKQGRSNESGNFAEQFARDFNALKEGVKKAWQGIF
jgi:hypothetical protein